MAGSFPAGVTSYTNPGAADKTGLTVGGRFLDQFIADHNDDLEAIMAKLGTSEASPADVPVAARLLGSTANGKSGWMQLVAGMIPNAIITAAMLASGAAAGNIGNGAILAAMLASGAAASNIGTGGVTAAMLQDGISAPKKIGEVVLGTTAATVTFSSIPGSYRDLHLSWVFRTNAGSAASFLGRINNDTGANYDYEVGSFSTTTASAFTGAVGQSSLYLGECTRTTTTANEASVGYLDIPNYAATTFFKGVLGRNARVQETYVTSGTWRSTSTINRLDLFPSTGSFIAGSVFTLWGWPA